MRTGCGGAVKRKSAGPATPEPAISDIESVGYEAGSMIAAEFKKYDGRLDRRLAEEEAFRNPVVHLVETYPDDLQTLRRLDGETDVRPTPGHPEIRGLIGSCCCGWPRPPTPDEVSSALRERNPEPRAHACAGVVVREGTWENLEQVLDEGSCTMQDVAWWMAYEGVHDDDKLRWLNYWRDVCLARQEALR